MSDSKQKEALNAQKHINRRRFIKHLGTTAFGGSLSLTLLDTLYADNADSPAKPSSKPKYKIRNRVEGMAYLPLGRTNLLVSRLALGGMPWQPTVAKQAIRLGVNLVHGCNRYGSMEAQAETLANLWDKCWYFLKHNDPANDMGKTIEKCLKTLKRDHVEAIVPVVGSIKSTDYESIKSNFEKLKKAGKVRFLGATVHTKKIPEVCREVIDAGIFDIILTMYQPANKPAIDKELARAVKKNIGTMSMKTGQGIETKDIPKAIAAALTDGKICTVLKGINSMKDLNAYLKVAKAARQKKLKQHARLDPAACGACANCALCPQNIEIQEIMRCATYYSAEPALHNYAARTYQNIPAPATVAGCIDCGRCEASCPRNLPIRRILTAAHEKWNNTA
ncbi:MAG: aldo-keto reductase family protein [Planctomycetota bacterium]|jgi:predicted aldo/keto reductase-like oxidoreductase